jgi:hypothetical protein
MKYVVGTLVILVGLALPLRAYALGSEIEVTEARPDAERFYETVYLRCTLRYARTRLSESEIDCLCNQLANHALMNREKTHSEKLPALPDDMEAACLDSHD